MFGHTHGKGTIVIDGHETANTEQCVHCGVHFVVKKGSGIKRGWCTNCKGITCGTERCMHCLPFEAWVEIQEGQKVQDKYTIKGAELKQKFGF